MASEFRVTLTMLIFSSINASGCGMIVSIYNNAIKIGSSRETFTHYIVSLTWTCHTKKLLHALFTLLTSASASIRHLIASWSGTKSLNMAIKTDIPSLDLATLEEIHRQSFKLSLHPKPMSPARNFPIIHAVQG